MTKKNIPSIGRTVKYWANTPPTEENPDVQPESATIVFIHKSGRVNLAVFGHTAEIRLASQIGVWNGEGERPLSNFAEWNT